MRYIPLVNGAFLMGSFAGMGELRDGRRTFFFTMEELLENTVELEPVNEEIINEWLKLNDRLN